MHNIETKQAIVVRVDLGMGKGKIAAQAAHAAILGYKAALAKSTALVRAWEESSGKKIVLRASSSDELLKLYARAKALRLPCALVRDVGLTQIPPGTLTALVLGPWRAEAIDKITGQLKLL